MIEDPGDAYLRREANPWRRVGIIAGVVVVQVLLVTLYLGMTGRVSVPYLLVPVRIIAAAPAGR